MCYGVSLATMQRIMLGANNYLGRTHHPEVVAAAKDALDRFGTGCTGSRMLIGTLNLPNQLEEEVALKKMAAKLKEAMAAEKACVAKKMPECGA